MDHGSLGNDPDSRQLNELASLFDAPAYIRRSRGVHEALQRLLDRCRARREEWLLMPRIRLGTLHAFVGSFDVLTSWLAGSGEVAVLDALEAEVTPRLRVVPDRTTSGRVLRRALGQLVASLTRFNTRWEAHLGRLDLEAVNELREKYNRYYVIEKACSIRSDLLARQGFVPMVPLTIEEISGHLPTLLVPRLASPPEVERGHPVMHKTKLSDKIRGVPETTPRPDGATRID